MNSRLSFKDLERKMDDGSTMFDFLVESENQDIRLLFHSSLGRNWIKALETLKTLSLNGAKASNIFKVLSLQTQEGHIGFRLTKPGYVGLSNYFALLKDFFDDGVLTDVQLLNLFKIKTLVMGKASTLGQEVALNNSTELFKGFLDLLELVRYQTKDVFDILQQITLAERKLPLSPETREKFNALYMGSLFDLLNNNQIETKDLPKYVAHQGAILEHTIKLPKKEKRAALRKILNPKTQLGQFFELLPSSGMFTKPNTLKKEEAFLFKALQAYIECASKKPESPDPDFCFSLAVKLNQLIKNRRTRSPVVLSALMKLLRHSLNNVVMHPQRTTEIFNLLMPTDKNEVMLRELVVNADSAAITKEYLELLLALQKHGLDSELIVKLVMEPMQHIYKNNASLVDLVSRHGNLNVDFIKLLSACLSKDPNLFQEILLIIQKPILSIGKVYSSYTTDTFLSANLSANGFSNLTDALKFVSAQDPESRAPTAQVLTPAATVRTPAPAPLVPHFVPSPQPSRPSTLFYPNIASPAEPPPPAYPTVRPQPSVAQMPAPAHQPGIAMYPNPQLSPIVQPMANQASSTLIYSRLNPQPGSQPTFIPAMPIAQPPNPMAWDTNRFNFEMARLPAVLPEPPQPQPQPISGQPQLYAPQPGY